MSYVYGHCVIYRVNKNARRICVTYKTFRFFNCIFRICSSFIWFFVHVWCEFRSLDNHFGFPMLSSIVVSVHFTLLNGFYYFGFHSCVGDGTFVWMNGFFAFWAIFFCFVFYFSYFCHSIPLSETFCFVCMRLCVCPYEWSYSTVAVRIRLGCILYRRTELEMWGFKNPLLRDSNMGASW